VNFKTLREKQKALLEDLETIQAAMKLLGDEPGREKPTGKKTRRQMSPETRARMAKAAKARWAKVAKKEA
jgi:hypothetical protein